MMDQPNVMFDIVFKDIDKEDLSEFYGATESAEDF